MFYGFFFFTARYLTGKLAWQLPYSRVCLCVSVVCILAKTFHRVIIKSVKYIYVVVFFLKRQWWVEEEGMESHPSVCRCQSLVHLLLNT